MFRVVSRSLRERSTANSRDLDRITINVSRSVVAWRCSTVLPFRYYGERVVIITKHMLSISMTARRIADSTRFFFPLPTRRDTRTQYNTRVLRR